jgi:DtxR family Mn-dependent transcriptional regulator
MLDRFHPPVEEYLEAIFSLEEEGIPVIQARLAERLDKAAPSVSEMLDRLEADDLIVRSSRQISMTDKGATLAEGVVRKHRLA